MDFDAIVTGSGQASVRAMRTLAAFLPLTLAPALASAAPDHPRVHEVGCVGVTVSDLDRSVSFHEKVLDFRKVLEEEDSGAPYEALTGVFALRTRTRGSVSRVDLDAREVTLSPTGAEPGRTLPYDTSPRAKPNGGGRRGPRRPRCGCSRSGPACCCPSCSVERAFCLSVSPPAPPLRGGHSSAILRTWHASTASGVDFASPGPCPGRAAPRLA